MFVFAKVIPKKNIIGPIFSGHGVVTTLGLWLWGHMSNIQRRKDCDNPNANINAKT